MCVCVCGGGGGLVYSVMGYCARKNWRETNLESNYKKKERLSSKLTAFPDDTVTIAGSLGLLLGFWSGGVEGGPEEGRGGEGR